MSVFQKIIIIFFLILIFQNGNAQHTTGLREITPMEQKTISKYIDQFYDNNFKSYYTNRFELEGTDLMAKYDMRSQKLLGPVRNQDNCGACWAFAAENLGSSLVVGEDTIIVNTKKSCFTDILSLPVFI